MSQMAFYSFSVYLQHINFSMTFCGYFKLSAGGAGVKTCTSRNFEFVITLN